jgi:hypothetical protein
MMCPKSSDDIDQYDGQRAAHPDRNDDGIDAPESYSWSKSPANPATTLGVAPGRGVPGAGH